MALTASERAEMETNINYAESACDLNHLKIIMGIHLDDMMRDIRSDLISTGMDAFLAEQEGQVPDQHPLMQLGDNLDDVLSFGIDMTHQHIEDARKFLREMLSYIPSFQTQVIPADEVVTRKRTRPGRTKETRK